ncbi:MAG: hypothetical protein LBJ10_09910 [Clostridiales bacterium]|nr:hypothetical protein [Clostridiales bacterium]
MLFREHPAFLRDLKPLDKYGIGDGLPMVKKLLAAQFAADCPKRAIHPGKIHHVASVPGWDVWKVEVVSRGLRPGQWPRMWFAVSESSIALLAIGTHIQNYSDNGMEAVALGRLSELLPPGPPGPATGE